MLVTALLTGRGNNSLKDKNIIKVAGKPVLYYPANAAKNCRKINNWFCSSNDEKILALAQEIGYEKIVRPNELAQPDSQHIDCILHALQHLHSKNIDPDILVVLLANNVTIKSQWITECIDKILENQSVSAVVPVYVDNDHHPFRAKKINKDGFLIPYEDNIPKTVSTNRQDLTKSFFLAHNFWVLNVKNVLKGEAGQPPWSFMGNKILPYIIKESMDIHTISDLIIAKEWLNNNYVD